MRKLLVGGSLGLGVLIIALLWWGGRDPSVEVRRADVEAAADRASSARCSGQVGGVVSDGLGRPVAGARVQVGPRAAPSDASGRFAVAGLPAGEHALRVEAAGLVVAGPPGGPPALVTLAATPTGVGCVDGLRLMVHRPGALRGRVVAAGVPVAARLGLEVIDARGLLDPVPGHVLDGVGVADADGRFALDAVVPGRLRVIAESEQHAAAFSREVMLREGERVDGLLIDLQPAAWLRGRVVDGSGAPVAGAAAVVSGGGLPHALRASSDGDGRFALEGLPVGSLWVRVGAPGYRGLARELEVAAAGSEVELVLERARGLFGQVLDPDDTAPGTAWVALRLERGGRWLRVDAQGRFGWADAPEEPVEGTAISPFFAPSPPQVLRAGDEAILRLGAGGRVQGTVLDSAGAPVSSCEVGVARFAVDGPAPYNLSVFEVHRVTRSDGGFALGPLRPGRYVLAARAEGLAPGQSAELEVQAGRTTRDVVIRLGGGASVRGQVRGVDGAPIAGARIQLLDQASPFRAQETRSDGSGRYLLTGLAEGRRSLQVEASGFLTQLVSGLDVPGRGELVRDVELGPARRGADYAFHGIGAVLRARDDGVEILQVMPGHGAAQSGLAVGDRILFVDGEAVAGLPLDQVVERIRGEQGVAVSLDVERPGEGQRRVEVERGEVVVDEDPHHRAR